MSTSHRPTHETSPRAIRTPAPFGPRPSLALALLAAAFSACGAEEPGSAPGAGPGTPSAAPAYTEPEAFAGKVDPAWFEDPPGEPSPIDGIPGFQTVSLVDYVATRGNFHRLDVVHMFPDRARWSVTLYEKPDSERTLEYQYGGHRYRKRPEHPGSVELTGALLANAVRQMKLREALMMYPHALEWGEVESAGGESVRVAQLGGDKGSIRVVLDEEGRPRELTAVNADGQDQETIRILEWQEVEGRTWPRDLELVAPGGELIWQESIKQVTTRLALSDRYFIPVDFKELPEVRRDLDRQPQRVSIPPMTIHEEELPPETAWEDALAAEASARSELAAANAGELDFDTPVSFFLGDGVRPSGFFIRLLPGTPAVEGWKALPQRRALTLFVASLEELQPTHLEALRQQVPEGAEAGRPYAMWIPGGEAEGRSPVQLVLPFRE